MKFINKLYIISSISLIVLATNIVCNETDSITSLTDLSEVVKSTVENKTKEYGGPENVPVIKDWAKQCKKKVGGRAWRTIKSTPSRMVSCFRKIVNFKKLQIEVNESMSRGELDLVFKKYCGYQDRVMACVEDVVETVKPCLEGRQFETLNFTLDAIEAGINFTCHENGDRIALFMAEEGIQCVENTSNLIRNCVETDVPELKETQQDPESLKLDVDLFSSKNCEKLWKMQQCVVKHTSSCSDPTPANILDSLIMQIVKATPCAHSHSYVISGSSSAFYVHFQTVIPYILSVIFAGLSAAHILL